VAELSPAAQEVANLQIKEADAHRHTDEAEERAAALVERVFKNDVKAEWVRKEQDDLL
jgi:predicted site-specific integrase-resolvase